MKSLFLYFILSLSVMLDSLSFTRVTRSLVLYVMLCKSLIVLLSFFFWPLCCLFFFDIRILITTLVSLNSSYIYIHILSYYKLFLYFNLCLNVNKVYFLSLVNKRYDTGCITVTFSMLSAVLSFALTGTTNPYGAFELTQVLVGFLVFNLVFYVVFCQPLLGIRYSGRLKRVKGPSPTTRG